MRRIHTIVIGAGQAGLAMSHCLTGHSIEHVVLERGVVAQRWSERWDSLRLLTPNWMTRLPGWQYRGSDPDGFMKRDDTMKFLGAYARSFTAPVEEQTRVTSVSPFEGGWKVETSGGTWRSENVVIATGHCHEARIPNCSGGIACDIVQTNVVEYKRPSLLPLGGVLVIGASAAGVQLAQEVRRSGRPVFLSVGRHFRVPRRYRGRDIHYWLDRTGVLSRPLSDMSRPSAARFEPSLQLAGGTASLDLGTLASEGVRLVGRVLGFDGTRAELADDLAETTGEADRRMDRVLGRIDRHIAGHGAERDFPSEAWPSRIEVGPSPRTLDLRAERISTVLWATGYRRSYPWLHAPVLDATGEIRHTRGRTSARGLYVLGLQFLTRRNSGFIDGVGRDAEEIAAQIAETTRTQKEAA